MASPIEEVYEKHKHRDARISQGGAWKEGPAECAKELWEAIKAELALREKAGGLASLIGKYDNDETWAKFPDWLKRYRDEMEERDKTYYPYD